MTLRVLKTYPHLLAKSIALSAYCERWLVVGLKSTNNASISAVLRMSQERISFAAPLPQLSRNRCRTGPRDSRSHEGSSKSQRKLPLWVFDVVNAAVNNSLNIDQELIFEMVAPHTKHSA